MKAVNYKISTKIFTTGNSMYDKSHSLLSIRKGLSKDIDKHHRNSDTIKNTIEAKMQRV